jgi:hypothetical protein
MRKYLVILIILCSSAFLKAQTVDFTINLIYELNIFKQKDLCLQYAQYSKLKIKSKNWNECKFRCKLKGISKKADSIILRTNTEYSQIINCYLKSIELSQFYSNKIFAENEFNLYYIGPLKEFNSDLEMFRYREVTNNIPFLYSDDELKFTLATYSLTIYSFYLSNSIQLELKKIDNSYVIITIISTALGCKN